MGFFNLFKKSVSRWSLADCIMQSGKSAAGVYVNDTNAMMCSTVYACVRVLAETVAQLPLVLYQLGDRSKTKATDHPLYYILHDQPNSWQTSVEFREMVMSHLLLRGNAYVLINRSLSGKVLELIPLNPDTVTVGMTPDGLPAYQVEMTQGVKTTLDRRLIMHLRGLTTSGFLGLSPIGQMKESIGLAMAAEEYGSRYFAGDGMPRIALVSDVPIKDKDKVKEIAEMWAAAYSGVGNSHRVAVLSGMKAEKIGISPSDSQFLETRKYQRTEIAAMFRVPPHKIGDLEKATFSNIEHQSIEFIQDSIVPWCRRIESRIKSDLLDDSEKSTYEVKFMVDGLLRGDNASRYAAYSTGIQYGFLTRNEVREKEDLNPVEGGDGITLPASIFGMPSTDKKQKEENNV